MKTKITLHLLYIFIAFLLVSFSDPYTIKRISDENFRYEFYVTDKTVIPKTDKIYYWFKGGAIHSSQKGFGGALLNNVFLKTYHSNQIAEKGTFKNGLKIGEWKTWYPNGLLETTQKWSEGLRAGMYYHYDTNGIVSQKGSYKNDKKQGKWYDLVKKDTIKYDNGIPGIKKLKISKLNKLTLKLQKLKDDANKKILKNSEKDKITAVKKEEKGYLEVQKAALVIEKTNAKARKKEIKEANIKAKKTKKENREANKNSETNLKKENLINRFFGKIFSKKQPSKK